MKIQLILLIFTSVFPMTGFAAGTFESGNSIYEGLKDWKDNDLLLQNPLHAGASEGYVVGVADTLNGIYNSKTNFKFCIPSGVTENQLVDVVFKYLDENPQIRHATADSLVAGALYQAFPCSK